MAVNFNANIKLLMGGTYSGGSNWNKAATDIDKCFKIYYYRKNISLEDIAARSHLSPNYFHRLFTKTFHVSPFSYIRIMRMEEAVRQLIYSYKTVKEIAYDSGYEDEAYFSRSFKKRYQVSPGKYRMAYRKKLP